MQYCLVTRMRYFFVSLHPFNNNCIYFNAGDQEVRRYYQRERPGLPVASGFITNPKQLCTSQGIASYEKVLSTNRADGDSMLSSLEAMISTLKDQLEVANSRYDMLSDRYRYIAK